MTQNTNKILSSTCIKCIVGTQIIKILLRTYLLRFR